MTDRGAVIVVGDAAIDVHAKRAGELVVDGDSRAEIRTALGGAGANTAAWLASFGVDAVLVARVGDDPGGRQVAADLPVRAALHVDPDAATCCVVVLVDGRGRRTMLSDRGAAARLRASDLPSDLLADARHLHMSGYVLQDPSSRPAGIAMLAAARAAGLSTSVDPQTAAAVADGFRVAVHGVDLLLPNTDELAAITGSPEPESATELLDTVGAVAVTRGRDGACWIDRHGIVSVPAEQVDSIDSTGAGDAFDAAVLAAWLAGERPERILRAGVTAGTSAVRQVDAQPVTRR
ncbi:MAG TPA: carbohydrate kinase family protein [Pseudonocardiaceae bacterium]|nr:carbohydrate kinase family protein [Pseudonocardiaceae bacterium]